MSAEQPRRKWNSWQMIELTVKQRSTVHTFLPASLFAVNHPPPDSLIIMPLGSSAGRKPPEAFLHCCFFLPLYCVSFFFGHFAVPHCDNAMQHPPAVYSTWLRKKKEALVWRQKKKFTNVHPFFSNCVCLELQKRQLLSLIK